ncbi:alanine--tRNA ligase [Proteobacteria bacterium 005FR1]|nr:alanine--tRNA ligase [Proteobacteria bacterium 005FR1]
MKSAEIRDAFLSFFEKHGHSVVASSSLVPENDPTLLFTNAGMVQFKDLFLGLEQASYSRAASAQRCVRAGGKHNDLENVGFTARHHTFFEMLGNFSFGDYFKEDAIRFAWEFLTEVLKIPAERLWITVHITDDEAADIWINKVGVDPKRFSRLDEDNFWQMGDTGPCGPSSEIFYDHGEAFPGGPPGSEGDDLDRYIEIWNLVFMQYERYADGTMKNLPKPSVDTGMGLERIAAVMQGVHSNYEIDLFQNLLKAVAEVTGARDLEDKSLRVIADHIRSCAFLVADGVIPSNEGRGYVLRRIIRRAIRHGHKLGQTETFFHKLVSALVREMGDAYPTLKKQQSHIEKVLLAEEQQFAKTLEKGMGVLEAALEKLEGDVLPGELVFTLHDTYGFPTDLTNDIVRERDLSLDMEGFERCMSEQRSRSSAAGHFSVDYTRAQQIAGKTEFRGYEDLHGKGQIIGILLDNEPAEEVGSEQECILVLDQTPFYGESGGQVGDTGYVEAKGGRFEVRDTQKSGDHHLHIGRLLSGSLKLGDEVATTVDRSVRQATALNHSATHLLHAALREVLGEHVTQKGSLVDSERLRFDFSHMQAVTPEELKKIEDMVNDHILANTPVQTELLDIETAREKGAMMLFGEKYGDQVRVLTMGDGFSVELCGGTHARRTGDIGLMRIVAESGIAAGVRRIEAVTGRGALRLFDQQQQRLAELARLLKAAPDRVVEKAEQVIAGNRQLEKEMSALKAKLASASSDDLLAEAKTIGDLKVLAKKVEGVDGKALRSMVDQLKNKLGNAVVLLAAAEDGKVSLVAGVSQQATKQIKAGDLVRTVAEQVGGKGGGRPDMAQGGGPDVEALPAALAAVPGWVEEQLAG